jgi:molybdopterin converting factor small subunit
MGIIFLRGDGLRIIIRLYGQLQNEYNTRELLIDLQENELTIEKLLSSINERYLPGILEKLFGRNVQRSYVLLHNGTAVKDLREKLSNEDVIVILPPAVGGRCE